jgi:hypothetical protein
VAQFNNDVMLELWLYMVRGQLQAAHADAAVTPRSLAPHHSPALRAVYPKDFAPLVSPRSSFHGNPPFCPASSPPAAQAYKHGCATSVSVFEPSGLFLRMQDAGLGWADFWDTFPYEVGQRDGMLGRRPRRQPRSRPSRRLLVGPSGSSDVLHCSFSRKLHATPSGGGVASL